MKIVIVGLPRPFRVSPSNKFAFTVYHSVSSVPQVRTWITQNLPFRDRLVLLHMRMTSLHKLLRHPQVCSCL